MAGDFERIFDREKELALGILSRAIEHFRETCPEFVDVARPLIPILESMKFDRERLAMLDQQTSEYLPLPESWSGDPAEERIRDERIATVLNGTLQGVHLDRLCEWMLLQVTKLNDEVDDALGQKREPPPRRF